MKYKYNEEKSLKELKTYIDSTYYKHYSHNNFHATEFIIDSKELSEPSIAFFGDEYVNDVHFAN